ncbi:MAG TPA: hypothetical protein VIY51_09655 [Xanthobacteraceae bacterium]
MSTPSGKPFDPFDLSPYAPKKIRERAALDESDNKDDAAAVVLPYAPRAALPPLDATASADQLPRDLDGLQKELDGLRKEVGVDKDLAAPVASTPDEPLAEKPAAAEAAADPDLRRLEASLQWIQREGTAAPRMPRATPLPPVSGLRPVGPEGLRQHSEQFINGVRVPPSLAPDRVRPPPMRERRDNLRGPLRVLVASVIAAPIAYYFSVGSFTSTSDGGRESGLASLASRLVASAEFPVPKEKLPPGEADDYNTVVLSRNKLVVQPPVAAPKTAPVRIETPVPPPAPPSPAAEQPPPAPAPKAVREIDPASIKLLMQQGEQFLASGDVLTARIVFQRAAEAGDAAAALALGATFDPAVLSKMGARGINPDIQKARMWYERAKQYGSSDAPRRLEALANR